MKKTRYNVSCAYEGSNQRDEKRDSGGSAWIGIKGTLCLMMAIFFYPKISPSRYMHDVLFQWKLIHIDSDRSAHIINVIFSIVRFLF